MMHMREMMKMSSWSSDKIRKKWNELKGQNGASKLVETDHVMNFFLRIGENGQEEIMLITPDRPGKLHSSQGFEITVLQRQDRTWATRISCTEKGNEEIFSILCQDLMDASENAVNQLDGLQKVEKRFITWQKNFKLLKKTLTDNELIGLVGELEFALNYLSMHYSWKEIMESWHGPEFGDRDYVFPNAWYEVKTVSTGKHSITISSLNQLESSEPGYLIQFFSNKTSSTDPEGISVWDLIHKVRTIIADPVLIEEFDDKLRNIGYVERQEYKDKYFALGEMNVYSVDSKFPRLVPANVPVQVTSAKYEISLSAIEPWRTTL